MQMNIKKMYFNNNINCFKQKEKEKEKEKRNKLQLIHAIKFIRWLIILQ